MVTVVIPSYNRANVIDRSVESVLNQSWQDFEIIVVDDGSADDTQKKIMDLGDSRIRYFKNEKRMGANYARNTGIQNAMGDYIAFQDSDDVWRKDKLEKQMKMFREQKHLDIVYSRYVCHFLNGKDMLVPAERFTKHALQEEIMHTLAKSNVIGTPTMIVRKKCFDESGMFDPGLQRFQDWEINLRFSQKYRYGFVDEALVDAYESERSITGRSEILLDCWIYILKKHQKFFDEQKTLTSHIASLIPVAVRENKLENLMDAFGRDLFYQSMYLNERRRRERQEVIYENYSFVKEWISREKQSKRINAFFERYIQKKIIVYGLGDIGSLFLNSLSAENRKKIKFVIDRNGSLETGYKLVSPKMLKQEDLTEVQCIINTAVAHEEEIRENLAKVTEIPVISLYDVIRKNVPESDGTTGTCICHE